MASIFEPLITSGQVDELADQAADRRFESQPGRGRQGLPQGAAHPAADPGGVRQACSPISTRWWLRDDRARVPVDQPSIARLNGRGGGTAEPRGAPSGFEGIVPAGNLAGLSGAGISLRLRG